MSKQEGDSHQQYVDRVRQNTQQFLEETLRDNERLRALTTRLESELEVQNRRVFAEYADIEQQNANLANLYVASYRLHASLDRGEVLDVIHEIIINLIGSEELAVFELEAGRLKLLSSFGVEAAAYAQLPVDDSPIGRTAATGEMYLAEPPPNSTSAPVSSLTTCIPLKVGGEVIGVIAVFRMLPQKPVLATIDRELFELLGSHAAMALYCAGLHARVSGGA